MSALERRFQLLIDQSRYARLESEAQASGRSVSWVIRQAIDVYLDADLEKRARAAERLLAFEPDEGVEPDWSVTKAEIEARAGLDAIQ